MTDKKLTGRGGPGRGQGPPQGNRNAAKAPGQKRKAVQYSLYPAQIDKVSRLALARGVSKSEFIRQLIDQAPE